MYDGFDAVFEFPSFNRLDTVLITFPFPLALQHRRKTLRYIALWRSHPLLEAAIFRIGNQLSREASVIFLLG
jgi:hypothetical protein